MTPYYQDEACTIYHGDCRDIRAWLDADVLITDPPYGIEYRSGTTGHDGGVALPGIYGDSDTSLRDWALSEWGDRPWVCFGSWRRPRPESAKALLVWDKGDHVGMGDLALPWKPNTEEVYVCGRGFTGHRGGSVLRYPAPVSWNSTANGRWHAHEKPIDLMCELVAKSPRGAIADPFMGSGTTLVAAKRLGRKAIGIEREEKYCAIAAKRLAQGALPLEFSA